MLPFIITSTSMFLDLPCSRRFSGFCEKSYPRVVARTDCWFP